MTKTKKKAKCGLRVVDHNGWKYVAGVLTADDFELIEETVYEVEGVKSRYQKTESAAWVGKFKLNNEALEILKGVYGVHSGAFRFSEKGYFHHVRYSITADYKGFRREDSIKEIGNAANRKLKQWVDSDEKEKFAREDLQNWCERTMAYVERENDNLADQFANQCLGKSSEWEDKEINKLCKKVTKLREQLRKAEDECIAAKKKALTEYVEGDEFTLPNECRDQIKGKIKKWSPRMRFR